MARTDTRFRMLMGACACALFSLVAAGVLAQGGPPAPDATPEQSGVSGAVLGGLAPVAAAGYRLQMTELVWAPGAYATQHVHPLAGRHHDGVRLVRLS